MVLAFLAATPLGAQATAGTLLGRVIDETQATIPTAAVEVRNEATGLTVSARTDSKGDYWIPALPPGTYRLTVNKQGFGTATRTGIALAIDQKMRVDVQLLVTLHYETHVSAQSQVLQTQSAETGEVIESQQILDLPLLGRSFLDLARLTSGVVYGSGGNTLNIAVNGQREFANSVLMDGVEVTSNRNNDTAIRPSVDSVEEFKVLASAYSAEYGRASGAVVAVRMKSGANSAHGDLYEFFRPNVTAARSFFATEASALKQHNFGGTVGGPIRKNRTFFFASYEGVRQRNAFFFLDSVPPAGQIRFPGNGSIDLSGLKDPLTGKQIPIFDPYFFAGNYYALPFPGNTIPANRASAAGKAVLKNFFPAPTRAGVLNGWFENFTSRQAYAFDSDTASGRLDHTISERDRISAVYHYGSFASNTGDRFAGAIPVEGGGDADYGDREDARNQALSLSETHVFSNRWLNEFRFGYTRYRLDQLSLLNGQDLAAQFGAGNVNLPGFPQTSGFPDIYLGFGAQTGGSTYKPLHFMDRNYQFSDGIAARAGRHEFKAGAQYRQLNSAPFFSLFPTGFQYYGGPGLSLTGDPSYSFYDPAAFYYNGGSDIADLLLGLPYSVNLGLQLTSPATRSWEGTLYAQDTWQITHSLALSLGLRYEYYAPWTEEANGMSNFDLRTRQLLLAGRGANSDALLAPDRNNFAPRIGVAWLATPRTVVRAGWGVFYSPENDAREDVLTKNYPFAVQQTSFNDIYGGLPFPYTLDAGVARATPSIPGTVSSLDPDAIRAATGTPQNLFLVDAGMRTGYSQLFNFVIQRQLAGGAALEAGYVGSVSRKLPYAIGNLNRGNRLTAALGQIQGQFSEGSANYHSMQLKASRRFSRGLSFLGAYTFAKNLDNGPAPFNLGHNLNSHNQPQDAFLLNLERAAADNDVRHTLVTGSLWELPFGKGRLSGGWQINGIATARSGLPVNVVRNPQATGYEGLRPNALRDPNLAEAQQTLARYFDTSAFSAAPFTGANKHALGNAGRNLARGPGLANLDFSVFKELLSERKVRLQLRFEFFNITNTAHFANPSGDMSSGQFGSITQTVANPRIVQFAAKLKW